MKKKKKKTIFPRFIYFYDCAIVYARITILDDTSELMRYFSVMLPHGIIKQEYLSDEI